MIKSVAIVCAALFAVASCVPVVPVAQQQPAGLLSRNLIGNSSASLEVCIRFDRYDNPANLLANGYNCDFRGWSKCDPYFKCLYRTAHNTTVHHVESPKTNNVDKIEYGLNMGTWGNPIHAKAPNGTIVDLECTIYDDDVEQMPIQEVIGHFVYTYKAGSGLQTQQKQDGSTKFTVSFYSCNAI